MFSSIKKTLTAIILISSLINPQIVKYLETHSVSTVKECTLKGFSHTVQLRKDGTVWSYGGNVYGQLGNGSTQYSSAFVRAKGLNNIVSIAVGPYHTVALKKDGTVWSWGLNHCGQLCYKTPNIKTTIINANTDISRQNDPSVRSESMVLVPTKVEDLEHVKEISAGGFYYSVNLASFTKVTFDDNTSRTFGDTSLFKTIRLALVKEKDTTSTEEIYTSKDKSFSAFISNGIIYVPAKEVAEKFGFEFTSISAESFQIKSYHQCLEFILDQTNVKFDDKEVRSIPGAPILKGDKAFIPLETITKNLHPPYGVSYELIWDKINEEIDVVESFYGI